MSINLWQDEQAVNSGGKSKVSVMVDKIQESLATQKLASSGSKPAILVGAPSSSSPLPDATAAQVRKAVPPPSPLQAKRSGDSGRITCPEPKGDLQRKDAPTRALPQVAPRHDTSPVRPPSAPDSFKPSVLHLTSKAPLPAYKRPSITRAPSSEVQRIQHAPPPPPPAVLADVDDFGDDFELSAEDLDELMVVEPPPLHQRPIHHIPPHPNPPPQQPSVVAQPQEHEHCHDRADAAGLPNQPIYINDANEDDDEFGCDDIDEASFAEAEMSATQAFRASLTQPRVSSVRSR